MDVASHLSGHHESTDPFATGTAGFSGDPDENAGSLANLRDLWLPCLNAIGARSVVEVGAYRGQLTAELVSWADGAGGRVTAIDPVPQAESPVRRTADRRPPRLWRSQRRSSIRGATTSAAENIAGYPVDGLRGPAMNGSRERSLLHLA
jgi:hypothetical protein